MNNELVSIIVPIYNVEKYLKRCLESLLNQTYHNIEIILVDDGSTDNSGIICDNYKKQDKRIVVIHKINGGLSDARNFGIEKAKGNYLMFIDSDDWVDDKYVEIYLNTTLKYNADIVIGNIKETFKDEAMPIPLMNTYEISHEEMYKELFLGNGSVVSACAKIYKKDIFKKYRYEKGKLYEDFLIFDKIIEKSKKIVRIDYTGYYYYIRNDSIIRSNFNENRIVLIDKADYYIKFCQEKYPNLIKAATRKYIYSCFVVLARAVLKKEYNSYSKKIRKLIIKHNKEILFGKEYTSKDKLQTIVINLGIIPYRLLLKTYYYLKEKKYR